MSDSDTQLLISALEEIRGNQRLQLEHQAEALSLQREQIAALYKLHEEALTLRRESFAIVLKQQERTERIQDRAEAIQAKGAQLVAGSRKVLAIVVPVIVALIIYISWLIFRH